MQDLTQGPISKSLLRMTSFMLVSMAFQTLYFLVDLYFVGRLGTAAVAAVSLCGILTFGVLAATQALGVGTTALVAHATGRKDRDDARLIFNQSVGLSLLVGVLYLALMTALSGWYARTLGADAPTAALVEEYLSWYVPATALQFAMVGSGAALRGTGNFKPGMVIQSATVLLNIGLAPPLIIGWGSWPGLGVKGAAIATFMAVLAGVLALGGYVLRSEQYLAFSARDLRPRLALWRRILNIGLPSGAEFLLLAVYFAVVTVICRPFGSAAQAGFGAGGRVMQALFLPVVALGFAVSPVAGQNMGARLPERVRGTFRVAVQMATAWMVVCTLLSHLFPAQMIGVFSNDPQVLAVGTEYLRIISFNFIASGVVFVASSMFQALGNTVPALLASGTRVLLVAVPAWVLSTRPGFQLRFIWYLSMGAVLVQMTTSLLLLRREMQRRLGALAPAKLPVEV